jgi:hypothetical protein
MSSARKRAAIHKANKEADNLRQRLMLAEHHASAMESFARLLAARSDELLATLKDARACLEAANNTPNGPITDTIWYGPAETLFDFIDAALEKVGTDTTAPEGHNANHPDWWVNWRAQIINHGGVEKTEAVVEPCPKCLQAARDEEKEEGK